MVNTLTRRYWVVRPYPNGQYRMPEFLNENVVAIGWPDIGHIRNMTSQEIKDAVERYIGEGNPRAVNLQSGVLIRFSREIAKGDIVFVPDGETIHIAEVESGYEFNKDKISAGYPHQCKVRWLDEVSRIRLQGNLLGAMRPRLAVYSLDKYSEEIDEFLEFLRGLLEDAETKGSAPELCAEAAGSGAGREVDEISVLIKDAMAIIKQSMRSEDPELRLAAAGIIIQTFGSTPQR